MATPQQTPSGELNLKQLLTVLDAYRKGDFSARMPNDLVGLPGKVADTLNDIIDRGVETTTEFGRVAQLVGKQGKLDERIKLPNMKGSWAKLVDSSNALVNDLGSSTNEIIRVIVAVAKGDLSQNVPMEINGLKLQGQFLKSAQIVNTMVTQLANFSAEVTRVAREVGTEGKLGGQATVKGVAGTWKDLTDNVNVMAANLTGQVRNIAEVTTAVANGDLVRGHWLCASLSFKQRLGLILNVLLPQPNLTGMNSKRLANLVDRLHPSQCLQPHLRLELGQVDLPLLCCFHRVSFLMTAHSLNRCLENGVHYIVQKNTVPCSTYSSSCLPPLIRASFTKAPTAQYGSSSPYFSPSSHPMRH